MNFKTLILLFLSSTVVEAKVVHETVKYQAHGKTFQGEFVFDDSTKGLRPGIVMVPEWWGLTQFEKDSAERLAKQGYSVFVMDYYGEGKRTNDPEKAGEWLQAAQKNDQELNALFDQVVSLLKARSQTDKKRIGAIGFGFGGGFVVEQARLGKDLKAVVNFYGGLTIPNAKPKPVEAEVLVLVGEDDWYVSADQIATFKSEMKSLKAKFEVMTFPEVHHSFANPLADKIGTDLHLPLVFDRTATDKSWAATEKLFAKQLVGRK